MCLSKAVMDCFHDDAMWRGKHRVGTGQSPDHWLLTVVTMQMTFKWFVAWMTIKWCLSEVNTQRNWTEEGENDMWQRVEQRRWRLCILKVKIQKKKNNNLGKVYTWPEMTQLFPSWPSLKYVKGTDLSNHTLLGNDLWHEHNALSRL